MLLSNEHHQRSSVMRDNEEPAVRLCDTVLLPDTPADVDHFGGHEKIAKSIISMVRTDRGGKAIALVGSWGSGKSTVIRILQKLLGQDAELDMKCFVFDAWAQKGAYLQRSFLESSIDQLGKWGWLDTAEWNLEKEALKGGSHLRTHYRTAWSRLTPIAALLALLFPIGITLLAQNHAFPGWTLWFGVGLCALLPLGIPLLCFLAHLFPGLRLPVDSNHSLLPKLVAHAAGQDAGHTEETYETPSPTPLQFEHLFNKLVIEGLRDAGRRLVLVIDNLDRVDAAAARDIWTTMQTFLTFRRDSARACEFDRFWLIVPFDGSMPNTLWSEQQPSNDAASGILGPRFMEKTFQVRITVPKPLLSQWESYLLALLHEALPSHPGGDFHAVYRVYDVLRGERAVQPTPRELKSFVNDLGGLHRIWCGIVPLPVLALYVRISSALGSGPLLEQLDEFVPPRIRSMLGEERWIEYIAAIHHGVALEDALEVTLGEPTRIALEEGNAPELSRLSGLSRGFSSVLGRVVRSTKKDWANDDPDYILMACVALSGLQSTSGTGHILSELRTELRSKPSLWFDRADAYELGFAHLTSDLSPDECCKFVVSLAARLELPVVENQLNDSQGASDLRAYVKCSVHFAHMCADLGQPRAVADVIRISDGDLVAGIWQSQTEAELVEWSLLVSPSRSQGILDAMARRTGIEVMCQASADAVQTILESPPMREAVIEDPRAQQAYGLLLESLGATRDWDALGGFSADDVESRVRLLLGSVQTAMRKALDAITHAKPDILRLLGDARSRGDTAIMGLSIAALLCSDPVPASSISQGSDTLPDLTHAGLSSYMELLGGPGLTVDDNECGINVLESTSTVLVDCALLGIAIDSALQCKACIEFAVALIEKAMAADESLAAVSVCTLLRHKETLQDAMPDDFQALAVNVCGRGGLLSELSEPADRIEHLDLFMLCFGKPPSAETDEFVVGVLEAIQTLSEADWLSEFEHTSDITRALEELKARGAMCRLGNSLCAAIQSHGMGLLGKASDGKQRLLANAYIAALDPQTCDSTELALLNMLITWAHEPCGALVLHYGRAILASARAEKHADRLMRTVAPAFLRRRDPSELRWLVNACERRIHTYMRPKSYEQVRTAAWAARSSVKGQRGPIPALIRAFAGSFQFRKKPPRGRKQSHRSRKTRR